LRGGVEKKFSSTSTATEDIIIAVYDRPTILFLAEFSQIEGGDAELSQSLTVPVIAFNVHGD
jgi:hypothetical protein